MRNLLAHSYKWGQMCLLAVQWVPTSTSHHKNYCTFESHKSRLDGFCVMLPLIWPLRTTDEGTGGGKKKKKQPFLLIVNGSGSNERKSNETASLCLVAPWEWGREGMKGFFVPPRSIAARWFYYEVENSLVISLLNSCVSKSYGWVQQQ